MKVAVVRCYTKAEEGAPVNGSQDAARLEHEMEEYVNDLAAQGDGGSQRSKSRALCTAGNFENYIMSEDVLDTHFNSDFNTNVLIVTIVEALVPVLVPNPCRGCRHRLED